MSDWNSNSSGGVTVILPSGESIQRASVTAADIKTLAEQAGVNKFDVKDGNDNLLAQNQFPVVSGVVEIQEYNEVKAAIATLVRTLDFYMALLVKA